MKVGDIYPTTKCGDVEVLEICGENVSIKFLDTGNTRWAIKCNLLIKKVSDGHRRLQELAAIEAVRVAKAAEKAELARLRALEKGADKVRRQLAKEIKDAAKLEVERAKRLLPPKEPKELRVDRLLREKAQRLEDKRIVDEHSRAKIEEVGIYSKSLLNDFTEDGVFQKSISVDSKYYYTRSYAVWACIIQRSNADGAFQKRYHHYRGTTVCKDWDDSYQSFAEWYTRQVGYEHGWDVDKDMLTGSKHYSPDTCILLPRSVNLLFADRCQGLGLIDATRKKTGLPQWRYKDGSLFTDLTTATSYVLALKKRRVDELREIYTSLGLTGAVFDKLEEHLLGSYEAD